MVLSTQATPATNGPSTHRDVAAAATSAPAPVTKRSRRPRSGAMPPLRGLLPLAVLLGLWQAFGNAHSATFPPPSKWWTATRTLQDSGQLWGSIGQTLQAFLIALAAATVVGSIIGLALGSARSVDRAAGPTLEFLRTMPAAAIVPLFTLLLGFTLSMNITVVVLSALWPVMLSVRSAMQNINPLLFDVARTLRLSRAASIRKIVLPYLMPSVLTGLRVATPITLIITLLAEFLTNVPGLGALLNHAMNTYSSPTVYALVAITGIIALVVNSVIGQLEGYVLRYQQRG